MEKKDMVLERETKKAQQEAEKRNRDLKQHVKLLSTEIDADRKELHDRMEKLRDERVKDQQLIKEYANKVMIQFQKMVKGGLLWLSEI